MDLLCHREHHLPPLLIMAEPFPWGKFKSTKPTWTLILTGVAMDVPEPKGCTSLTQALLLVPTGLSDLLQLLVLDGQGSLPILQPRAQGQIHPGLGAV